MQILTLNEKLTKLVADFILSLKNIYTTDLVSVILHGSAVSGEFIESYSNLDILIVLKNTNLHSLKKAYMILHKLPFRRINPLFLTEEQIKSSLDVFPIEFLDMQSNHICLEGKDVLVGLTIDAKNLRFQCEQELKSKLIILKQKYLRINQNDKISLSNLLFNNFTSVVHILHNVIRIKNKPIANRTEDILREAALELQVSVTTFMRLSALKKDHANLNKLELEKLLFDYVYELEKIAIAIDQL
jgi:predicted nucleotidyltransferase